MKRTVLLFLGLLIGAAVSGQELVLPSPLDTISDYAGVTDAAAQKKVKDEARELRKLTTVNLKIAVIYSPQPLDTETYGERLYQAWDVGKVEEGADRGVLLLISIIDHQVRVIAGKDVTYILTPYIRDMIEWSVIASLVEGKFSEGAVMGTLAISEIIKSNWPKGYRGIEEPDWGKLSLPLFFLLAVTIILVLLSGGTFLTAYGMIIGGVFGYLFFGLAGMFIFAAIGFFLNYQRAQE